MSSSTNILETLESSLHYNDGEIKSTVDKKELSKTLSDCSDATQKTQEIMNELRNPLTQTNVSDLKSKSECLKTLWENVDSTLWTFSNSSFNDLALELVTAINNFVVDSENTISALDSLIAVTDEDLVDPAAAEVVAAIEAIVVSGEELLTYEARIAEVAALTETEEVVDEFLRSIIAAWDESIIELGSITTLTEASTSPDDPSITDVREGIAKFETKTVTELNKSLNDILHNDKFKSLESNWTGVKSLLDSVDWTENIIIDLLDCTRDELGDDLAEHSVDLTMSEFFKKVYVQEYDQYGGQPFGAILGIYDFENTQEDRDWLTVMSQVSAASHVPFIASVGPKFFNCSSIEELSELKDIDGLLAGAAFDRWNEMRETEEAAYLGFTVPKYLARSPYDPESNPAGTDFTFTESIDVEEGHKDYLWSSATFLFGQNLARSFTEYGWCQFIRGPKSGGLIESLPRHEFEFNGQKTSKSSVEIIIPDYLELQYANNGFIPLVYRKGTTDACFFSCQSIKKPKDFVDTNDSENSQLVTNLSYTLSITRIAHYIKSIMRDNIGSSADEISINTTIQNWLNNYVTTVVKPSDLTLRRYPFKAAQAVTIPQEGMIGWYNCEITILPHIQFEGMDIELKMDVRL